MNPMQLRKKFFSALAVLAFGAALFAQSAGENETLRLTVDDAVGYALEGNLSLKQSEISLQTAKHSADLAWGAAMPSISASGSFTQSFIDPGISSVTLGGSISLALTPALYTAIRSAVLSYEQQQITYGQARKTIELNVRQLFTALLYQQEYIALLEKSVESAQRQFDSDTVKYNRGTLPQVNLLSDQVSLQQAQLNYESQKISFENNRASFKQILGIPQSTQISLEGSLNDILSAGEITMEKVNAVRQKSTEMAALEKQMETADNALLATRFSAWGPVLSVAYNINWSGNNSHTVLSPAGMTTEKGDFEFGSDPSAHALSLGVSIPLDGYLPWSSGARSIAAQKSTVESLKLSMENQRTTEDINIQNYLNTIKSTQDSMKLGQSSVELAQQNLALTEAAYNHGTRSLLELQTARDNLNSAMVNVMSNASTLITAILNLESTIGVPFGTLTNQAETE